MLDQLPAAGAIQPYLPTHYWMSFIDLFREPVSWAGIKRGLLLECGYGAAMVGLARIVFGTRDITS